MGTWRGKGKGAFVLGDMGGRFRVIHVCWGLRLSWILFPLKGGVVGGLGFFSLYDG